MDASTIESITKKNYISRTVGSALCWGRKIAAGIAALSTISCSVSFGLHKPNIPYEGPMPPSFSQLAEKNPLFAEELLKIPDIRDGVTPEEAKGIDRLVESYNSMPQEYDRAFQFIYKVGKPEVRPYNSGVETLFWIFENGNKIQEAEFIIEDYRKEDHHSIARMYLGLDLEGLMNIGWNLYDKNRWGEFNTVVNRLNAPEPISYYTTKAIKYDDYSGRRKSNSRIVEEGTANCYDTSIFIKTLLHKGGYKVELFAVDGRKPKSHVILGYTDDGKFFFMNNGHPSPRGIEGPFGSYEAGPYKLYELNR